ncbi:hypothetical protein M8818_006502 [Zalaria obscura]|uniref:Uncharacterized protein n=1 Tax=Zalaria obscura TaxID=2024903 RepID=A0ACC3S5X7_9PEZI
MPAEKLFTNETDFRKFVSSFQPFVPAVASRRYSTRSTLLVELQQPVAELLWSTVSGVPQTYHIVKALCLLCAWPLPTSSTSVDPSMMICGTMVQLAMQFGLHRPSHAQDFSRYRIELREEDIRDRMNTWVAVNLMAQNISTGYGMPQISRWNWYTHGLHLDRISATFHNRCLIERFNDKITRTLYTMQRDEVIKVDEAQRALTIDMFARELVQPSEFLLRADLDSNDSRLAALVTDFVAILFSSKPGSRKGDGTAVELNPFTATHMST